MVAELTLAWLDGKSSNTSSSEPRDSCQGKMVEPPTDDHWADVQTVMMRNIPNNYSQERLRQILHQAGFQDTYDFFYLPIDGTRGHNRGYAFINFKEQYYVSQFRADFDGKQLPSFGSSKVLVVSKASLQGYEANYAFYSSKSVCKSGKHLTQPLFLREQVSSRLGHVPDWQPLPDAPPGLEGKYSWIDTPGLQAQYLQNRACPEDNQHRSKSNADYQGSSRNGLPFISDPESPFQDLTLNPSTSYKPVPFEDAWPNTFLRIPTTVPEIAVNINQASF